MTRCLLVNVSLICEGRDEDFIEREARGGRKRRERAGLSLGTGPISIKIKGEGDATCYGQTRGEREEGKTQKERKTEGEEEGKKKKRVLGGISRGETESSGRYTAKCRGGFISLSVLFIDVLSASLVPTVARALSFLCRCLYTYIYTYIAAISRVLSSLSLFLRACYRESAETVQDARGARGEIDRVGSKPRNNCLALWQRASRIFRRRDAFVTTERRLR